MSTSAGCRLGALALQLSSTARASRCIRTRPARQKNGARQALGRSRGGLTTKLHAACVNESNAVRRQPVFGSDPTPARINPKEAHTSGCRGRPYDTDVSELRRENGRAHEFQRQLQILGLPPVSALQAHIPRTRPPRCWQPSVTPQQLEPFSAELPRMACQVVSTEADAQNRDAGLFQTASEPHDSFQRLRYGE